MSRTSLSITVGFVSAVILSAFLPAVAFGQESTGEGYGYSKLPFLKEASSGSKEISIAYDGTGLNGPGQNGNGGVKVEPGGLISQANGCRFRDVSGHKSEQAINYLYDKGVTGGRRPCYFDPNAAATRAEAATMVVRAINAEVPQTAEPAAFPDTNVKSWNAKFVKSAKNKSIVHGYPDGQYRAEKSVNKVEALKIVTRGFQSDFSKVNFQELKKISDIELNQWYVPYVQAGLNEGLIAMDSRSISPAVVVSRAELAEMIYQMMIKKSTGQ